jgi:hypothetical protein
MSVEEIDAECTDGEFCGSSEIIKDNEVLEGPEAADAVRDTGSSTDFFQMDENGNELDDDDESGPFDQLGYEQTTEE